MPLTGIDLISASLLIDTQSPLDVLQATADRRLLQLDWMRWGARFTSDAQKSGLPSDVLDVKKRR